MMCSDEVGLKMRGIHLLDGLEVNKNEIQNIC